MPVNGKGEFKRIFFFGMLKKKFLHVNILKRESRRKFHILHVYNLGNVVDIKGGSDIDVIWCWKFLKKFKEMLIKTNDKIRNSK